MIAANFCRRGVPLREEDRHFMPLAVRAAENGDTSFFCPLGTLDDPDLQCLIAEYYEEHAIPPAFNKAAVWYIRAANQGHSLAHNNLGVLYAAGHLGKQDFTLAAYHFKKSLANGLVTAESNVHALNDILQQADDSIKTHVILGGLCAVVSFFLLGAGPGSARVWSVALAICSVVYIALALIRKRRWAETKKDIERTLSSFDSAVTGITVQRLQKHVSRKARCPCGSGKIVKNCCGKIPE